MGGLKIWYDDECFPIRLTNSTIKRCQCTPYIWSMSTTTNGWVNGSQCAQNSTHSRHTHAHTETKEINNQIMNYSTHIVVVLTHSAALHNAYACNDDIQWKDHIKQTHAVGQSWMDRFWAWWDVSSKKLFLVQLFMTFAIIRKEFLVLLSPFVCLPKRVRLWNLWIIIYLLISCKMAPKIDTNFLQ